MVIHKYLNPQVARDDNDVLFISGIVAGWVPKAKAQLRYIKNALKRVLVSNRALVCPFAHVEDPKIHSWLIEELGANSLIAKNRLTPRYFHDLEGEPSAKWPLSTRISGFSNQFWTPLVESLQVTIQAKQRTYFYFHNTYLPLYFAEKFEQQWEDIQNLHPQLTSRTLVSMCLSSLAETDAEPFVFFSSLFGAIKDDIEEYITDTSKSNKAIASSKLKSKAHAILKRNMDSDDSAIDLELFFCRESCTRAGTESIQERENQEWSTEAPKMDS